MDQKVSFGEIVKHLDFPNLTHFETLHETFYEDWATCLCTNSYKII